MKGHAGQCEFKWPCGDPQYIVWILQQGGRLHVYQLFSFINHFLTSHGIGKRSGNIFIKHLMPDFKIIVHLLLCFYSLIIMLFFFSRQLCHYTSSQLHSNCFHDKTAWLRLTSHCCKFRHFTYLNKTWYYWLLLPISQTTCQLQLSDI